MLFDFVTFENVMMYIDSLNIVRVMGCLLCTNSELYEYIKDNRYLCSIILNKLGRNVFSFDINVNMISSDYVDIKNMYWCIIRDNNKHIEERYHYNMMRMNKSHKRLLNYRAELKNLIRKHKLLIADKDMVKNIKMKWRKKFEVCEKQYKEEIKFTKDNYINYVKLYNNCRKEYMEYKRKEKLFNI